MNFLLILTIFLAPASLYTGKQLIPSDMYDDPPPAPSRPYTPPAPVRTESSAGSVSSGPLSGMEFVTIPSGSFRMGSMPTEEGRGSDESPRHTVDISSFQLMTTEVTQQMWGEVMGNNPSYFVSPNRPVEKVSWDDVQLFIEELNSIDTEYVYRLPSESEWEYACRAGTTTPIYSGTMNILGERNCPELDDIAWYGGNSGVTDISNGYDSSDWSEKQYSHTRAGTHPVATKLPNDWGLYDMLGNVWEWCEDTYQSSYKGAPTDGSAWVSSGAYSRVGRGGSWLDGVGYCRSADRLGSGAGGRYSFLGFRLARSVR
ncbi:MAG: formylglycine-generating enzyme family protein [Candidatus Sabulitectum sp.]|nr:formylglycine-generating enzyme family protein [Candidatus Sabulitectum sp.]